MTPYADMRSALEHAIFLLECFAKDVPACEYLDDDLGQAGRPTVLSGLRAALPDDATRPGDVMPHNDVERTVNVVRNAYGWAVNDEGRVCGLVAGDMGYESTHIVISPDDFPDTAELVAVLRRAMPYLIHARDRALYRDAGLEAGAIGTVLFDANEAIRKATGKEALNPTFTALLDPEAA